MVIIRISEAPKKSWETQRKKTCSVGKRLDEFPRPAKPRDTAVNWQSTVSDVTMVEYLNLTYFGSIPLFVPPRLNSLGDLQFGRLFPRSCLKREDTSPPIKFSTHVDVGAVLCPSVYPSTTTRLYCIGNRYVTHLPTTYHVLPRGERDGHRLS